MFSFYALSTVHHCTQNMNILVHAPHDAIKHVYSSYLLLQTRINIMLSIRGLFTVGQQ